MALYWQHWLKLKRKKLRQGFVISVASTRVLKLSQIFSKNAKFTLTLMSKEKLISFNYKFRFYTSSMYEIAWFFLIQNELWTM